MKRLLPWLFGAVVILPLIAPFLRPGLFRVHDYTHVTRVAELDRTIRDGAIPPRWSKNLGFGYGEPLFSFYAPLPYYAGVLFHAVGFSYIQAVKLLFIFSFFFSYMAMYAWSRSFCRPAGSMLAAVLFLYVPYRAVDVYARGALGELYGILFIVLWLGCITRLIEQPGRRRLILSALAGAGLLLSHNLMTLVGVPLVAGYSVWLIVTTRPRQVKTAVQVIVSFFLAFGLAAYFFVPAIVEKNFTSVDQLTKGGGEYSEHFVYFRQLVRSPFGYGGSIPGIHDGLSFEIGLLHWLGIVFGGILLVFYKRLEHRQRMGSLFLLIITGGAIYLMTIHSYWLWQLIPPLRYLQFPWRLLAVPLVCTPLLTALVVEGFHRSRRGLGWYCLAAGLAAAFIIYQPLFKPEKVATDATIYDTDPDYIKREMSTVIPDYIHPQLSHLVLSPTKDILPATSRFELVSAHGSTMSVVSDTAQAFTVQVEARGPYTLTANIFDFPGWQWTANGKPVRYTVGAVLPVMSYTSDQSTLRTEIISAKLSETPVRRAADWISIGTVILLGWFWITSKTYRKVTT